MVQLYFLSILCNGLSGFLLFTGNDISIEKTRFSLNNPTVVLILGILSAVTGVLKLLSPYNGQPFFVGDLIPAAAGIVSGLMLIFGIYRQGVAAKSGELGRIGLNLLNFRKPIGLGLLACAFLHFIIPKALFL